MRLKSVLYKNEQNIYPSQHTYDVDNEEEVYAI